MDSESSKGHTHLISITFCQCQRSGNGNTIASANLELDMSGTEVTHTCTHTVLQEHVKTSSPIN
jgi:hypothetical protein